MCVEFFDGTGTAGHEEFQRWRAENPSGYFINFKDKEKPCLHRSKCHHFGRTDMPPEEWGNYGSNRKICAATVEKLERWAKHEGIVFERCKDCFRKGTGS